MHSITPYLRNPNHAITISVIGCGGTGSRLLPRLAQMNYAIKHFNNHPGFHVEAFDNDIVEPNNVGRQNFTLSDVGENKAYNIIGKCNMAYGTFWEADDKKFVVNKKSMNTNIIITCVDTPQLRVQIDDFYKKKEFDPTHFVNNYYTNYYWIDCGNGKDFGQVVLTDHDELKTVIDLFPNYKNQKPEDQKFEGCASYAEKLEEQGLFINDKIAVECSEIIWKLLTQKEISVQGSIFNQATHRTEPLKI